jgi:hypothetical protein
MTVRLPRGKEDRKSGFESDCRPEIALQGSIYGPKRGVKLMRVT